MPTRVLFVCMGNICRSPTAEAVMQSLVAERGLDGDVEVDSAGTTGYHAGDRPDSRAVAAAARRGVAVSGRARQVTPADFAGFDLLVAMDEENRLDLLRVAPPGTEHKIRRLADVDVPDPYYGGPRGFEDVLDVVEAGCSALLDELITRGVRHG